MIHRLEKILEKWGSDAIVASFYQMLLIRHFELRAEAAYQNGKIGGFFHSYIGQEAIQAAALLAFGSRNWYSASYRCHALALLLGVSAKELMAELFGKATGNAKGRGGSMHFFTDRLLGGFGIVGGQVPIAAGAGFAIKYRGVKDEASICFLGDGAVVQGAFHESLNLASLWNLPCIFIIENNQWGMGTAVVKAVAVSRLAEDKAFGYNMKGYTVDGMDFCACLETFHSIYEDVLATQRPVLVEVVTERFKGHSISDPAHYRSKEALKQAMQKDPIVLLREQLEKAGVILKEEMNRLDKKARDDVIAAVSFAEESPFPDPMTLEDDVFAPEES